MLPFRALRLRVLCPAHLCVRHASLIQTHPSMDSHLDLEEDAVEAANAEMASVFGDAAAGSSLLSGLDSAAPTLRSSSNSSMCEQGALAAIAEADPRSSSTARRSTVQREQGTADVVIHIHHHYSQSRAGETASRSRQPATVHVHIHHHSGSSDENLR